MTSQAAEITKAYLLDAVEEKPLAAAAAAAAAAFSKLKTRRQIQDFLKKGGRLQPTLAIPKAPVGALAKATGFLKLAGAYGPAATGGIEGAKGLYLIGKEEAREGHAEAGEELMKRPKVVQAAKLAFNTADSISKYGAAGEARTAKRFREQSDTPASRAFEAQGNRRAADIRELLTRSGK